jgi:perosamine synthetase
MKIPFHRASIDDKEINAVAEVLKSGWLTMGGKTFEFEKLFAEYTGAGHAVAVNSCTSALHLALKVIDLKPGDEVIIPAITFIATWEVVTYFGAVPVIADVEKDTHLLDAASFESKITSKTKAVIPVHYSGQPCDMDLIIDIARQRGIYVIEDAAHSLPAYYKNRPVGSIGDFTCFSFYATKTVTTGEGGMITTEVSDFTVFPGTHGTGIQKAVHGNMMY